MMQDFGTPAKLFVVGSFVVACTVRVAALPRPGETLAAGGFLLEPGGKGFNLAVAARRLGAEVDGVLAIGDDAAGALAAPAVEACGLPRSMLVEVGGQTGGGVGFIASDGETCLAVHSGANGKLAPEHLTDRTNTIARADLVLAQCEVDDAPIAAAFAIARAAGVRTMLNPSPFRASCVGLLGATSILCLNATEASALADALGVADDAALAQAAFTLGPEALVVTSGPQGATAYLRQDAAVIRQPAFRVEAIDTLGAGDAFAAGLTVALAEGAAWPDAMRRAAACGAIASSRYGVLDALPMREAQDAMLQSATGEPLAPT